MEQDPTPDPASGRHPVEREIRQSMAPVLTQAQDVRAWALRAPDLSDAERAAILAHVEILERTAQQFVEAAKAPDPPPARTSETQPAHPHLTQCHK